MRVKWFSVVRVTGLILVLLYHFFKGAFPGGFIGVDIFFTFSGYLITALLIDEFSRTKKVDYLSFLKRRFYRIVPPLVIMVLVVMPLTFLVRRDFVADIGRQIATTLGFTTNLYETFIGANYENQFTPHLFLHTWSLAVEVHYYILWGAFVWLMSKRMKRASQFRGTLFLASSFMFVVSFLSMFVGAFLTTNYSNLYFSSLSHSFPFFVGSFLATLTGITDTTKRFKRQAVTIPVRKLLLSIAGAEAVLVLLTLFMDFNHIFTYLLGFLLTSIAAGVMIYNTRLLHEHSENRNEPKILTFFSDTSYGIYLFHWPLFIIFNEIMPLGWAVFFTTVLSVVFAGLSYYVAEPIIAGKTPKLLGVTVEWQPYRHYIAGVVGILTVLLLGIVVTAPKVGNFEKNLLVSSLEQSQSRLDQTHTLVAGDATAISDILIIGDSVTLRASDAISQLIPEARVDSEVSRGFDLAFETFNNLIEANNLPSTVVLAVGVNSLYNYEEDINQFMEALPKGHRLVLVTPYNAKDSQIREVRAYELDLAKKYSYVEVADWYQTATDNSSIWVGTDGVHFSDASQKGAELYAETIQKAIEKVAKEKAK